MQFKDFDYNQILADGHIYRFDYAVRQHLELEKYVIVRLTNYDSDDIQDQPSNNLYVIEKNTRKVWNMKEIIGDNPYFGNIYIKTYPEGRTISNGERYPGQFRQAKVIASDSRGYFHTIDMETKTRIDLKQYRLEAIDASVEINISLAEEVDDYAIVLIHHICTVNMAKHPDNNIYAINRGGKILWNIKDIINDRDTYCSWLEIISSPSDTPYMLAYDYIGIRWTIDLQTKTVIDIMQYSK